MISSKELYSKYFSDYTLKGERLQKLQDTLLDMFLDFKRICDKHDIDYMLCGGTLLGAVRHGGFIPWDDDIDIMMLRGEYEKFQKAFYADQEMVDKYCLANPLDKNYICKQPKMFKRNSVYMEVPYVGTKDWQMIFLDIFLIENCPDSQLKRKIDAKIYSIVYKGASACVDFKYPSFLIQEKAKENADIRKYYFARRALGFVFTCLGGMSFYLKICERLSIHLQDTKQYFIPSGGFYELEIYDKPIVTELTTMKFCGYDAKVPKNYDYYLTNLYGEYMQIPPVNQREYHVAYKVVFDTSHK